MVHELVVDTYLDHGAGLLSLEPRGDYYRWVLEVFLSVNEKKLLFFEKCRVLFSVKKRITLKKRMVG